MAGCARICVMFRPPQNSKHSGGKPSFAACFAVCWAIQHVHSRQLLGPFHAENAPFPLPFADVVPRMAEKKRQVAFILFSPGPLRGLSNGNKYIAGWAIQHVHSFRGTSMDLHQPSKWLTAPNVRPRVPALDPSVRQLIGRHDVLRQGARPMNGFRVVLGVLSGNQPLE